MCYCCIYIFEENIFIYYSNMQYILFLPRWIYNTQRKKDFFMVLLMTYLEEPFTFTLIYIDRIRLN